MSAYSSSEKTCNLCHARETCGVFRPLIIHLIYHKEQIGKDHDDIFVEVANQCNRFTPLPGGGEGTTEYVAERHEDDNCIEDCPLCEKERDRAEELREELKGYDK